MHKALKTERLHIHVDIQGRDTAGRTLLTVSGTYLSTDANENAEYLTMDELLITDDASDLFAAIGDTFKRLRKH